MHRRFLILGAALLAAAPSAAAAGPSSRMYKVSLTGTQQSEWRFTETGTCTGDDFVERTFSGEGTGTSTVSFKARPMRLVVSRVVGTRRWAFAYQPYDVRASGVRTGTHSQVCPGNDTATFTSPSDGCGERTFGMAVKAPLNLPANKKPNHLDFTATEHFDGAQGARWGDDCPYFHGLDPSQVEDELGLGSDWPGSTLLGVRKPVATGALRRGRTLVIDARRTRPYETSEDVGDTVRTTKGETTIRFRITMTPVRR